VLLVLGALLAGMLTTLAPCVLPLLPVVVGGAVTPVGARIRTPTGGVGGTMPTPHSDRPGLVGTRRALVVTAALGVSVTVFTLLLQASTALIGVPRGVWQTVSGGLLVVLGLTQAVPVLWERLALRLSLGPLTGRRLAGARARDGVSGAVLTGAALGPVFSSCSPLYGYLVVTMLPAEPGYGLALLLAYVVGLCATLLLVALAGQRLIRRLRWAADPDGLFRRGIGVLLVAVGVLVLTGGDHALQAWVIEHSPVRPWELDSGFIPG
jgi:cytochrome c-type biogenesis protein